MNHPDNSTDLYSEIASLASLGALDGADAEMIEHCGECKFGRAARAATGMDETVALMAASVFPAVAPPAGLKEEIMSGIAASTEQPELPVDFIFKSADEADWVTLPGGKTRLRVLSDCPDSGHTTVELDADPGGGFSSHVHKGAEEIYLISGDLESDGRLLKPGDFLRAAPGSRHQVTSPSGCRAIVVTSRDNYQRKKMGIYAALMKSIGRSPRTLPRPSQE